MFRWSPTGNRVAAGKNKTKAARGGSGSMRNFLKWGGIALAIIITLPVVMLAAVDWNQAKGRVAVFLSNKLDREVTIRGNLDVKLFSWHPLIVANDLSLANASWAMPPENMAEIAQLKLRVALLPLLRGRVVFNELSLTKPTVTLQRRADGQANWMFSSPSTQSQPAQNSTALPEIEQFTLQDGTISIKDEVQDLVGTLQVNNLPRAQDGNKTLHIEGEGQFHKQPLTIAASGASPLNLREANTPYPMEGRLVYGKTVLEVGGGVGFRPDLKGTDVSVKLSGPDMARIGTLLDLPVPETPPYTVTGQLTRPDDHHWKLDGLDGTIGESVITGDVIYEAGAQRPKIYATINSKRLDFDDLAPMIGGTPTTDKGERASSEQKQDAQQAKAEKRLFPTEPLDLSALNKVDLQMKFRGQKVTARTIPMDQLHFDLQIENGKLTLKPLSLRLAGGEVDGGIFVDGSAAAPRTEIKLGVKSIQLAKLVPKNTLLESTGGRVGGTIDLKGNGNSVAEFLAKADGDIVLVMESGRLDNLMVEAIGLDAAEALLVLADKEEKNGRSATPLRCAVAAFAVKSGAMQSRALVADTQDSTLVGEGGVNLGDENLDLKLEAHPKDNSLLTARAPIHVKGRLLQPDVRIEKRGLVARTLVAVGLAAVLTPVAAIIPFVEVGTTEDQNCNALFAEARKTQKTN